MKIKIRQKLLFLSLVILAGNGSLGYAVYESNRNLRDAERWMQHTEQVISQAASILSLGKDIESASRGFVITNDSAYLEPLLAAEKTTFPMIRQLKELTRDSPLQRQRADSLDFYMHQRLDFSSRTIEIRSKEGLAAAIAFASISQGKYFTDQLRRITLAIQNEESQLLEQRKQSNDYSVASFNRFSMITFILMAGVTILLLLATGNYLVQYKEKGKLTTELMHANHELGFQNKEKEKRAAELSIANQELAFQNEQSASRAEQLINANKELESFSYSVSHDLRAPLRAVHGYTRMLKEDHGADLGVEANRLMTTIMLNAKKMGQLIDDLLTFSRLGRREMVHLIIPMQDMVASLCREATEEQVERNLQFKIGELLPAMGDRGVLKQVWENLISNAVKYSRLKEKAIIEIGSKSEGDEIIYSIKDNGAGFDMRYVSKLFGVFQRLHSDEHFAGTGVGLAIVHRIISKHGGRVWAEGKENEGATFYFSLPLRAPARTVSEPAERLQTT